MKDLENTMFEKSLDEILCEKNFQIALNLFKKTALGIDKMDFDEISSQNFINSLKNDCLNLAYSPEPVLQKFI